MAERPIIMSAPMVRAILAGAKTQTRRVMRDQPCELLDFNRGGLSIRVRGSVYQAFNPMFPPVRCPYGKPGDRLWVRETWARTSVFPGTEMLVYREGDNRTDYGGPWKPGIHMFRRDSRITLEVTGVRTERLQDISETDAIAEGIERRRPGWAWYTDKTAYTSQPITSYRDLWESINGPDSWRANPWVWAITFRRLT